MFYGTGTNFTNTVVLSDFSLLTKTRILVSSYLSWEFWQRTEIYTEPVTRPRAAGYQETNIPVQHKCKQPRDDYEYASVCLLIQSEFPFYRAYHDPNWVPHSFLKLLDVKRRASLVGHSTSVWRCTTEHHLVDNSSFVLANYKYQGLLFVCNTDFRRKYCRGYSSFA